MSTTDAEREALRAAFVKWLVDVHLLDSEWQPERNCFADFPAHLAWQAFQAGRAQAMKEMAAMEPVAWLYVPSDVWNSAVVTMVKAHADEARKIGREVTALIPRPKPTAPEGGKP